MSIQGSINQMLGSVGTLGAISKHFKEQEVANEQAKGKELIDLKNAEAETEEKITGMQESQRVIQERNPEIGTPTGNVMLAQGDEDLTRAVKAMNILDRKITAKQAQLGWISERINYLGGRK